MAKKGISRRRASSSGASNRKPRPLATEFDPDEELRDAGFVQKAIMQAIAAGDRRGVETIFRAHIRALNRSKAAEEMHVSREYLQRLLSGSQHPSLETFISFMRMVLREKDRPELVAA